MKIRTIYYLDVRELSAEEKEAHVSKNLDVMSKGKTPVEEVIIVEILGNSYVEQVFVPENDWEAQSMAFPASVTCKCKCESVQLHTGTNMPIVGSPIGYPTYTNITPFGSTSIQLATAVADPK